MLTREMIKFCIHYIFARLYISIHYFVKIKYPHAFIVDINFNIILAYAQQLEDMIAEKQDALEALREKTRAFR